MQRALPTLVALALLVVPTAASSAQSAFLGNAFGRSIVSGAGFGVGLNGLAQQSITPARGAGFTIYSTLIAYETPVTLGITDRISIQGNRVVFKTDFDPASGNGGYRLATGTASIQGNTITYRALARDKSWSVQGTLRASGGRIVRTETRREAGGTFRVQIVTYP